MQSTHMEWWGEPPALRCPSLPFQTHKRAGGNERPAFTPQVCSAHLRKALHKGLQVRVLRPPQLLAAPHTGQGKAGRSMKKGGGGQHRKGQGTQREGKAGGRAGQAGRRRAEWCRACDYGGASSPCGER